MVVTTQTVTVLFTDLVGSTELSSRLGPEATESLRQTHFSLLRGAIASAGGTEVKNLGDGLMVAFTSLSRALACAVGMQQAIERHNRRGEDTPLSVRIGISTGEATEEDGDYFGDPVVEAARLCAAAAGGQILATEVVKLVAGRHATQEFVSVGELALKGLPDPVPSVEVVWEPVAAESDAGGPFPLPGRLVGASAESLFAFFGRADELARLADARKASATERRLRVMLLSGEPGIGKTTLVAQAARAAHEDGANVVYGYCEEGLGVPYQPWLTALSQLVTQVDEAVLREFIDANGVALARVLPDLARRIAVPVPDAGSDADAERFLVLEGVARLLALASADAPLVVVLDDLHWVDAASLQLLRHLVLSANPMAVTVVGTFRESELSRSHPLTGALADLRRVPDIERLDLVGLDDVDIIDLLAAASGQSVADDSVALAHALRRETGGNPFFLVEVIRHLAESGAFIQDDTGRWVLSEDLDALGLPSSVREVVGHRVARLGEATEQALSLGAVMGREFEVEVLVDVGDTSEDELLDLLDGAVSAGLITESEEQFGRYRFVHALIQHTLYQDLSGSRRQRAHQRIAESLERRSDGDDQVAELARHWLAATRPSDSAKAIHYARRAGDLALAAYAPLDAVDWYAQALDLQSRQGAGDDRERAVLLVGLGTAQRRAGKGEHHETLREAGRIALRLDDRDLLVLAGLSREPGFDNNSEVDPDRLAVLEAALAAVGPADSATRARLLACQADEMDPRDVDERCAVASEALDVAHRLGDDDTLLAVINMAYFPLATPDTLDRRRRDSALALELSEGAGDLPARFEVLISCLTSAMEVGELDEVDRLAAETAVIAGRTGLVRHRWQVASTRSWRSLLSGRIDDAERAAEEALEIGTLGEYPHASGAYGAQLIRINLERGRLDEIIDLVVQAVEDNPTLRTVWEPGLMFLHAELERFDEASALFDRAAATGFRPTFDNTWLSAMTWYADVAADLGRTDAAPLLYERLLPYRERIVFFNVGEYGSAARSTGRLAILLGRYDDADGLLQEALASHERLAAPYWIARTQIDLAELAVARGGPGSADATRDLLDAAQGAVDRYGYAGLQRRIDKLRDPS